MDCALECPGLLAEALDTIGGKWAVRVFLAVRLAEGPMGFARLQRELGISPKELTRHLRQMERQSVITRHVSPSTPPRVDYAIAPRGAQLFEALEGLAGWSRGPAPASDRE